MKIQIARSTALFSLGLVLSGCAHYQYRLVQPEKFAQTVIDKQPVEVAYEPLLYRFAKVDNQLAVSIVNPTDNLITLVGSRSYLVAPDGQTHPLGAATVAPHSHLNFALPPQPPRPRTGPSFGFGLGLGTGFYGGPMVYPSVGVSSPVYYSGASGLPAWDWKTGQVLLRFFYEQEKTTNTFDQQLVISKEKTK